MKLFFYDLETTGLDPVKNGIHQISGEIFIDNESKEKFNFRVQPHKNAEIDVTALRVADVTTEQIMSYPSMRDVYCEFEKMLEKYVDKYNKYDKFFLAGYNNVSFDDQFLRNFFLQNGDTYFGSWFWANSIDVMVLASAYLATRRSEMANFKLHTVAKFLELNVDDTMLHDAEYDIKLTQEIFKIVTNIHVNKTYCVAKITMSLLFGIAAYILIYTIYRVIAG
jgi:DNA polymerase-3 subunit epsilon